MLGRKMPSVKYLVSISRNTVRLIEFILGLSRVNAVSYKWMED